MKVSDDGVETDVAHQGHGLQRALLLATLQELARSADVGDVPAVMLAIEEPELYQHPVQARHFSAVLASLPREGEGAFQAVYATHSAFFVDPRRYERLRRFTRRGDGERIVSVATVDRVAEKLEGIVPREEINQRITMTLERTLAEAVFADAAVLVEGRSDAGLLSGAAEREGGFASLGVAVVSTEGKSNLPIAWAILQELGVPTYLIFDADRNLRQRMLERGVPAEKARQSEANVARQNQNITRLLTGAEIEWPDATVEDACAVFEVDIEDVWPEAIDEANRLAEADGDWRSKPDDWYRAAAADDAIAIPEQLDAVLQRIRALV
jgi:predicted ATP-dependent endonuclease of OLD family